VGLAVGAVAGFVFALRLGVFVVPLTAVVLWRGIGPRALVLTTAALLGIAVPAIYLAFPTKDLGGFNFSYATHHLAAHWVAVVALVLLGLALWRTLAAQRRVSRATPRSPATGPPAEASPPVRA
jgi:hypothetical protein